EQNRSQIFRGRAHDDTSDTRTPREEDEVEGKPQQRGSLVSAGGERREGARLEVLGYQIEQQRCRRRRLGHLEYAGVSRSKRRDRSASCSFIFSRMMSVIAFGFRAVATTASPLASTRSVTRAPKPRDAPVMNHVLMAMVLSGHRGRTAAR